MGARVLIVDDHPSFRAAARLLLEAEGYDVVGEAADGRAGLAAAARTAPEVVLLDVGLPDLDGLAVAARLRDDLPGAAVVLVSSREAADVGPLAPSGARGFIPKGELTGAALRAVLSP